MVMIYETLALAFVALITPFLGKIAGYELRRKPFEFVAASGLFFMLTVAFSILPLDVGYVKSLWYGLSVISYFIGWISLLVGCFWELFAVITIPEAREDT